MWAFDLKHRWNLKYLGDYNIVRGLPSVFAIIDRPASCDYPRYEESVQDHSRRHHDLYARPCVAHSQASSATPSPSRWARSSRADSTIPSTTTKSWWLSARPAQWALFSRAIPPPARSPAPPSPRTAVGATAATHRRGAHAAAQLRLAAADHSLPLPAHRRDHLHPQRLAGGHRHREFVLAVRPVRRAEAALAHLLGGLSLVFGVSGPHHHAGDRSRAHWRGGLLSALPGDLDAARAQA